MSIRTVVTRGYGNGTYSGIKGEVTTRGYTQGLPIVSTGGWKRPHLRLGVGAGRMR